MDTRILKHTRRKSRREHAGYGAKIASLLQKDLVFSVKLNNTHKQRFFSGLSLLLSSGVDLQTVLELSSQGTRENKKLKELYDLILAHINRGHGLGEAMQRTNRFNSFDYYSVIIGESTGELPNVFQKLDEYYRKKIALNRKLKSALSYPVVVLVTTVLAVSFMLQFVVPMFANTLVRFGGELPFITKVVIACSDQAGSFLLLLTSILIISAIGYVRTKNNRNVQTFVGNLVLRIPFFGRMIKKIHCAQFAQAMELLLASKVGVVESIRLAHKMVTFYPLADALESIEKDLASGSFFHKSMERQLFFEQSMIVLVRIGEEVNQLDTVFGQLSKQYEQELDHQTGILLSVLEPLLILFLALIVGTILIAMYLPMFKIGAVVQ